MFSLEINIIGSSPKIFGLVFQGGWVVNEFWGGVDQSDTLFKDPCLKILTLIILLVNKLCKSAFLTKTFLLFL